MAETVERVARDFSGFRDIALAVILFGSFARGEETERSDVDVCIVAGKRERIKEVWDRILESGLTGRYDVKIFELLPLKLKIEVIRDGKVVFCRDRDELDYLFWKFRKIWNDEVLQKRKLGLKIYG